MLESPARRPPGGRMARASIPAYSRFRTGPGRAYNEAAFLHFLAVDRRRAQRGMRSLLLVLVTVRQSHDRTPKLTDRTAAALFAGLGTCIRETDFVGWYKEDRIAAAVLPLCGNEPDDVRQRTADRVLQALRQRLSAAQSRNVRVRVVRLGGKVRI